MTDLNAYCKLVHAKGDVTVIGVTVLFYVKTAPKQARELSMELTGAISLRRVSVL